MNTRTLVVYFFFFQAEDGIRDYKVTGVQTCALPISGARPIAQRESQRIGRLAREDCPQVIDEHTHTGRSAQLDAMDEEHPPRRGAPRWKQEVKRAAFGLVAHQPIGEQRDAGS